MKHPDSRTAAKTARSVNRIVIREPAGFYATDDTSSVRAYDQSTDAPGSDAVFHQPARLLSIGRFRRTNVSEEGGAAGVGRHDSPARRRKEW